MKAEGIGGAARIIFIDDEASILKSLRRLTHNMNAETVFVTSGKEALDLMEEEPFDLVVSDMQMPEMDGATLLAQVAQKYPETMRLVLTGYSDENLIMSAINEGRIWGFIKKPWEETLLLTTLQQAITAQQMVAERALLRHTIERYTREYKNSFMGFIGSSLSMQLVYNTIERSAVSDASVFITGPSGTGKEVCAEAIHKLSKRSDGPFIALNCAAIPKDLMESEIFGHIKGAFSGAISNRDGAATLSNGGTLFLDELSEMDIGLQAKLLRFIQTGSIQKVGSSKTETLDIRFVCATNRSPIEAIDAGLLREDLYYRLNVVSIDIPPLNARDQDAILLAQYFLKKFSEKEQKAFAGFSSDAERLLIAYEWPGNVRQLENCVYSAVVMSEGPLVTPNILGKAVRLDDPAINRLIKRGKNIQEGNLSAVSSESSSIVKLNVEAAVEDGEDLSIQPLCEIERAYVERAIDICQGNVVKAASSLGVSPSTLYRKIQNWETADAS